MTPRQQADMLFNKIMTLHEAGKTDSVTFFAPMALAAYANLGSDLDADARLHLGLILMATGQNAAATAQGDTIIRGARTHLFGWLLKGQAALQAGDSAAARSALRTYLQNYQSERAKNLPEYAEHTTMLQEARDEAERLVPRAAGK
jgi:Flp pilus assembly protein TadD